MIKRFRLLLVIATFFTLILVLPARGQDTPPPPPAHSQNGNQGTGCPIDHMQGIILAAAFSLGYAIFALYLRGKKKVEK